MTVFTASFSAVSVGAATQDLFELVPDATTRVRLLEIEIAQYSPLDFGDMQAEILGITILRGHTTGGSGGSVVTPVNVNPYGRASVTTVEANNTTLASAGSPETLLASGWHIQAGFIWRPPEDAPRGVPPFRRHFLIKPSQRLVIRTSAPADELTLTNGTVTFEEIGKAPTS